MLHQEPNHDKAHHLDPFLSTLAQAQAHPGALPHSAAASAPEHGHSAAAHAADPAAHAALFGGMYGGHGASVGAGHEPHMGGLHGHTTLFAKGKGDKNDVALNDIKQGQLGDCFFLSSMGAELTKNPNRIKNMIHEHHGKHGETYTVDFQEKQKNGAYKDTPVTVDGKFPTNGMHTNLSGDTKHGAQEIWPLIMEKAYAKLHNGYHTINKGGNPAHTMSELTGHDSQFMSPKDISAETLKQDDKAGKAICFDSKNHPGDGLVGSHAYSLKSIVSDGHGGQKYRLNNPWGKHQPKDLSLAQLRKDFGEVDIN